jgi:exodeoxyribonuclease VII small subunit
MSNKLTFEEAMSKIEEIAEKLENGKVNLDEMVELYKQGTELSVYCNKMIDEAEQKIRILSKTGDGLVEKEIDCNE